MGRSLPRAERALRDAAIAEMRKTHKIKDVAEHFGISQDAVVDATRRINGPSTSPSDKGSAEFARASRASSAALLAALQKHHVCPKKRDPEAVTSLPLRLSGSHNMLSLTGSQAAMCLEMKGL